MYTSNVIAVPQDESMGAMNSLGRLRQLDAYKAAKIAEELRIKCTKYLPKDLEGKVISFEFHYINSLPSMTKLFWAKVSEVYPPHDRRAFVPKSAEDVSPKLAKQYYIK